LTLIVDSYAWVEFLSGGDSGPKVRSQLESREALVTLDIVLAEVARVFGREGVLEEAIAGHLRSIAALSDVRPIDHEIALGVVRADRDLRRRARERGIGSPSFADSLILSCARQIEGRVLTADPHFEGLKETAWIGR
jgi:predicted nucleic acid-binding protein